MHGRCPLTSGPCSKDSQNPEDTSSDVQVRLPPPAPPTWLNLGIGSYALRLPRVPLSTTLKTRVPASEFKRKGGFGNLRLVLGSVGSSTSDTRYKEAGISLSPGSAALPAHIQVQPWVLHTQEVLTALAQLTQFQSRQLLCDRSERSPSSDKGSVRVTIQNFREVLPNCSARRA